ncbi:MAG TPA: N-acetyltransferase [Gaiellaceae bacterium]|nr:N-acetyltransferase [Gaiellaceae bacterium]
MPVELRLERPADVDEVARVIEAAFGDAAVAAFAARIRSSRGFVPDLAFVAEEDGEIVGHTMLSEVGLEGSERPLLTLTPVSVRPDRQRRGIGSALVRAALAAADGRREPLVLVEGIPAYYPRFGFRSATEMGLERPDPRIPDAAWMAVPLTRYDPSLRGRVVYPDFFPPPPGA